MKVVTDEVFAQALSEIKSSNLFSFDTETNGLNPHGKDRLFAVVFSTYGEDYYFNFKEGFLGRDRIREFSTLFSPNDVIAFAHNAKFDMHFLRKEGVRFGECKIHDTEVFARILYNQHMSYKLSEVAGRYGMEKLGSEVEDWLSENKAFEEVTDVFGETSKRPMYEAVPDHIMIRYATRDARITFDVGVKQLHEIEQLKSEGHFVADQIEYDATKALFDMEHSGIKCDMSFVRQGLIFEKQRVGSLKSELDALLGKDFVDHSDHLAPYFLGKGIKLQLSPTGRPSITQGALESMDDPLAIKLLKYRDSLKRYSTYWSNIVRYADQDGVIHPNFRQSGAQTLRTSCTQPNMQNATKDDESEFPFRRCFVPREGFVFVEMDFAAQEFRLAVEYAGEKELARQIIEGYDPHTATAEMTGLDRRQAKILNFGLIYGMGAEKLSRALGCDVDTAKKFKHRYFSSLSGVKNFIYRATDAAKLRGYVKNWAGVRYYFTDPNFAYKAANSIIQGGCAYITKNALGMIHRFLAGRGSKLILQVHDSILLEIPEDEFSLIHELRSLMIMSYPYKIMPMDASVEWSRDSWGSLQRGVPCESPNLERK